MKRVKKQRIMSAALVLITALAVILAGCATGSDARGSSDSGPDEVVGQAPDEESEDFEFAPPPRHPGDHGDVSAGSEDRSSAREVDDSAAIRQQDLDELERFGPSVVMKHVTTEPFYEDDEFVGFEIVELTAAAKRYVAPDLQVGDVVTHVNLVRLETPDDYMEAWDTLEEVDEIRLDLVRQGEEQEVIWGVE